MLRRMGDRCGDAARPLAQPRAKGRLSVSKTCLQSRALWLLLLPFSAAAYDHFCWCRWYYCTNTFSAILLLRPLSRIPSSVSLHKYKYSSRCQCYSHTITHTITTTTTFIVTRTNTISLAISFSGTVKHCSCHHGYYLILVLNFTNTNTMTMTIAVEIMLCAVLTYLTTRIYDQLCTNTFEITITNTVTN